MSIGPRVVFTRFVSRSSPKLDPWRDHATRVMGHGPIDAPPSDDAADGVGTAIVWHLVSANNRMLARSAHIFQNVDAAQTRAQSVVANATCLDVDLVGDESRGMHGWLARLDDSPVMTCARWYLSDRERRHSIELATASIAIALLRPGVRQIDAAVLGDIHEPIGN